MRRASRRQPLPAAIVGLAAVVGVLALACAPASSGPSAPPGRPAAAQASGAPSPDVEASSASPSPQPVRLHVAYSELTAAQVITWTAYEAGLFAHHGLDVELSYIASAQTVSAILAGDVDVALGGGYAAIASRLAGSDLVIFLGLTTWYPYELMASPEIGSAADLRGKTVGLSRFGSSSDVATRVALEYLGLDPERDVTLIQIGSLQDRFAAMRSGAIAAGLVSPPQTTIFRRQGFRSLLDLSATGLPTLNNVGFASESWLRANEATAQALTDAMAESLRLARTDRALAERVISQYLKLDDPEAAADAYDFYVTRPDRRLPEPSVEAGRQYLESLAATDPRARGARAEDFYDLRFIERVKSGE